MSQLKTSIILHYSSAKNTDDSAFMSTIESVFAQTNREFEVLVLSASASDSLDKQIMENNPNSIPVKCIDSTDGTLGENINRGIDQANGEYVLYLDNRETEIVLKQGAIDLYLLTMEHHPNGGLIYADYELEENNDVKEIKLLKHHIGRLRDNQDYGRVYFIRKSALKAIDFVDEKLSWNTLYDLRLKISERHEMIHIANRYSGSLYREVAASKEHNVFDYLMASKDSQLESEQVVTDHLKRIEAKLEPGAHYSQRPQAASAKTLKASVIIPVNNRPEFIGTAIESVQAQSVKEVEAIVVVNGGPEDPTITEVKRYLPGGDKFDSDKPGVQLLVYDINNLGLCLNMGAKAARGIYYVQLDSDDRLKADAVEKILAVYDSDPKIGMVIGSYEVWKKDSDGSYTRMEELPVVTHDEWTEENGRNNLLRINGAGAPRSIPIELINQIGFSVNDEPFARNYGEDYHMVLQISERYRIGRVWDAIYEVVRHAGGTDHSIDQATIDRNDEAKDFMRYEAINRRISLNK